MPRPVRNGTSAPPCPFTDLPLEIFDQVVAHLPYKAAHNLALCSSGLYAIETLWRSVLEEPFGITLRTSGITLPSRKLENLRNTYEIAGTTLRLKDFESLEDHCRPIWVSFKKFAKKYPHRAHFVKRIAIPPSINVFDLNWICEFFPNLESIDTRASSAYTLLPTMNNSAAAKRFWDIVDWKDILMANQCLWIDGVAYTEYILHHFHHFQTPCEDCIKQRRKSHGCFEFVEEMFESLEEKKGVEYVIDVSDYIGALSGSRFKHSFEASSKLNDTGKKMKVKTRGRR